MSVAQPASLQSLTWVLGFIAIILIVMLAFKYQSTSSKEFPKPSKNKQIRMTSPG